MANYKKMYLSLFNDVSKAIEFLQSAQRKTEELFINSDDELVICLSEHDGSNHDE